MATKKKTTTTSGRKGLESSSVVGINVNGISKMQEAIDAYIQQMQKEINIGISTASMQKGIKGNNSINTLRQLTSTINDKVKNYMLGLNKFKDQLENVKTQYVNADTNNTVFSNMKAKISK